MLRFNTVLTGAALLSIAPAVLATDYDVTVINLTRGIHFTPLLLAAHPPEVSLFAVGSESSVALRAMAEGGDTTGLAADLESVGAAFTSADGLLAPGEQISFTLSNSATPENSVLSLVGMLLPTNDGFVGLSSVELPRGAAGTTVSFDALGYDAGTEANDERVGSGAPGEAGFPAPPPVVATGTGMNASGVPAMAEGFVHVHRNVLGDTDAAGGSSDINSTVHRWLNPVARISITIGGE